MDNEIINPYLDHDERQSSGNLRRYLTVIFKHKTKIVTVFLAVVAAVTLVTFLLPPVFQAKSSILVKIGREYMNNAGAGQTVMSVSQEEIINSEIQILTNRDLIKQVITSLGIAKLYPELLKNPKPGIDPLEEAADVFAKQLKVEGVKKSSVIEVSFRNRDPRIAAQAVNTLVALYTVKHLQVFSDPRSSFLEKQLTVYEQKLRESENSLQSFKQRHQVFSLDDQRKLLLDQRTNLDTALDAAQDSIAELQKKIGVLQGQKARLSQGNAGYTQTERDKIIVEGRGRLLSLQLEEQELLKKYTDSNVLVANVRKEIRMVKDFLGQQERDINRTVKSANPVYQNVEIDLIKSEADLNSQKARAATLRQQLQQTDGELQALDFRDKDLQRLKREQAMNEKNYQTYADRTEEARITDDMNRLKLANISVIEKASVPERPLSPKKKLNIALGIVFGALAGLGFAFFSEYAAQSLSTPESVEQRLELPVLAVVPYREG